MTELINLMEETVLKKIDQLWPGTDYCKCEQCRMDIATYALNRLPAQYVQSLKGKVLYRFEANSMQRDIEVTVAVGKGIEIVGQSPHKDTNANIDEAAKTSDSADLNEAAKASEGVKSNEAAKASVGANPNGATDTNGGADPGEDANT
ncbi:MAG: late competence development ComFB family protein [Acetatifactor sp.]|nr:late competence development ComFB family protein [Acetatifactor sp.]